jgi:hypothetical protein
VRTQLFLLEEVIARAVRVPKVNDQIRHKILDAVKLIDERLRGL